MRELVLHNGMISLVDDEDYLDVAQYSWTATQAGSAFGLWYACRCARAEDGSWRNEYLHRKIAGAKADVVVDHQNQNGLDNRRANLRFATRSQNNANSRRNLGISGYRGVYPHHNRFVAKIGLRGRFVWLGSFATAEDAARRYDAAAREAHGDFATLNFPGGGQ